MQIVKDKIRVLKKIIKPSTSSKIWEEKINVKEQQLQKVTRNGYTVVEWGATIIE